MKKILKYLLLLVVVIILMSFIKLIPIIQTINMWWLNIVGKMFGVTQTIHKIIIASVIDAIDFILLILIFRNILGDKNND